MTDGTLQAPVPLADHHDVEAFASGASRTYALCRGDRVVGFYALAAGSVSHDLSPRKLRQNMPDPVPVMVLARLAVDARAQGMKLGAALLQDALQRCVLVSQNTGVRAMLVHALNDRARQFYEHYGFKASPAHPMTLMLRLNQSST